MAARAWGFVRALACARARTCASVRVCACTCACVRALRVCVLAGYILPVAKIVFCSLQVNIKFSKTTLSFEFGAEQIVPITLSVMLSRTRGLLRTNHMYFIVLFNISTSLCSSKKLSHSFLWIFSLNY